MDRRDCLHRGLVALAGAGALPSVRSATAPGARVQHSVVTCRRGRGAEQRGDDHVLLDFDKAADVLVLTGVSHALHSNQDSLRVLLHVCLRCILG